MSQQQSLFHDSVYDALAADVAAIGGVKKVAWLLWPSHNDGAAKLRACLSVEHAQKLDAEEVISIKRLARDAGSTATVNYEAQLLGYRLEWTSPEDEHARLQREFIEMGKQMQRLAAQITQTDQRVRVVK